MKTRKKQQGFTLIELMIVVAIIAIIAAVAIPSLRAARMHGNEGSAIASLRVIGSVNEQYRTRFGNYATTLNDLMGEGYIDNILSSGSKSGYDFAYIGAPQDWEATAEPVTPGRTGDRYFFMDVSGVIRFSTSGTADATSNPID